MKTILKNHTRTLLSLTADEMVAISNALNEVCNGIHIEDAEFETRLGLPRSVLQGILADLNTTASIPKAERSDAWSDGSSVQVICITAFGDPVDMSSEEARRFAEKILQKCDQ